MRTKVVAVICALALFLGGVTPCCAQDEIDMMADVVLVRPGCFIATIVGSAFFVLSLPFAAPSHSIKSSAHMFVVRPARATFIRPLGDMDALQDY